jgi:hypothetical protein
VTTIFISGSRVIPYLPEGAKTRLDRIIQEGHDVVVGDSDKGVDAMVASYLADKKYDRVSIFSTRLKPRLKTVLPSWKTVTIDSNIEKKINEHGETVNQRDIETEKDRAMGKAADFGFVIWKPEYPNRFGKASVSKGSLRNMVQLLNERKPVVLYIFDETDGSFELVELRGRQDLDGLIEGASSLVQRSYQAIVKSDGENAQEKLF